MARKKNPDFVTINCVVTKQQRQYLRDEAMKKFKSMSAIIRGAIERLMKGGK